MRLVINTPTVQNIFSEKSTCLFQEAKDIISLICTDVAKLVDDKGYPEGSLVVEDSGAILFKMTLNGSVFKVHDPNSCLCAVVYVDDSLHAYAHCGDNCDVNFTTTELKIGLDNPTSIINAIYTFWESVEVSDGDMSAGIVIVDSDEIYDLLLKDDRFDNLFKIKVI